MSVRWSTSRVEAFSDGVFAIAITLLVLDIKIDPADFDHLWRALADEWPAYLAYVTSFLTVGGVWLAHHGLFGRLDAVDPVLMRLNLLLLMAVSFLPFPTGLMAEALTRSDRTERAAVVVYGGMALLIEAIGAAMWRYAASRPGLRADAGEPLPQPANERSQGVRGALYGVALFVGILVLPKIAAFGYFVVAHSPSSPLAERGACRCTALPVDGVRPPTPLGSVHRPRR